MTVTMQQRRKRCDCELCNRSRKYYRITAKLAVNQREWMRKIYDTLIDAESVLKMEQLSGGR